MALLLTPDKEDNVQMGHAEKLVVAGDLDVKTEMLFYKKDDLLVVDSQVIIVPKGITEQEMKWQIQRLRADKKVYVHRFADGEDEMELMEVSVMTSDKAIFIRRASGMSLAGKTNILCYHPMENISPVRFGDQAGVLNLGDICSVTSTPAAWAVKTTRGGHFQAAPAYGIIRPGATTKISLRFAGFGGGEEPSPTDRVAVVWRDVEADAVFARQLFLADNIVIQKKVLPIRYLPN